MSAEICPFCWKFIFVLYALYSCRESIFPDLSAYNAAANMKHTVTCDMIPLTKNDLILVHKQSRSSLAGRVGLVVKVTSQVHIMDASPQRTGSLDTMELNADSYYRAGGEKGYSILQTAERMVRFVVLDVEACDEEGGAAYEGPSSGVDKFAMADITVARESDLGSNDTTYSCVTHLGHLIQPGDVVLGYDLVSTSATLSTSSVAGIADLEEAVNSNFVLPDVVLVKKIPAKELQKESVGEETPMKGKKRISKRKLRKQKKLDQKQRELEETAVRMGFFDDNGDGVIPPDALENDPDLAADLRAMELQMAQLEHPGPEE